MHPWASAALSFAAGFWTSALFAQALAIYAFDQFERAWGRGPSLQVASWVLTGCAVVVAIGSGVGFRLGAKRGAIPDTRLAILLGVVFTLLMGALVWVLSLLPTDAVSVNAASGAALIAVSAMVTAFASTRAAKSAA